MQQTAPLVYVLLLNQYNDSFTAAYLLLLGLYIIVLMCTMNHKKASTLWLLVTGLIALAVMPLLYRLAVRVYCLMAYGC